MAIPSFRGLPIFGLSYELKPMPTPARVQENTYPGIQGVDALYMGSEGGLTLAEFLLWGMNEFDLDAAKGLWVGLVANALPGVLVDSLGHAWPNVYVREFAPVDAVKPHLGGVSQVCRAVFRHLT